MKNSSFMRINNIFLFLCLFFLTSTSNLYAQDEFDEGIDLDFDDEEGIMWGDEVFKWNDDKMRNWWKIIKKTNPNKARESASLLYHLMHVLGDPISPSLRATLIGPNARNRATKTIFDNQFSIEMAVNAGNLAETITLILISLDKTDFTALSTSELILIVDSVNKLGLHEEARKLAFEIVVSQLF